MQYIANKNRSSLSKPSAPTCPPWITAYKSSQKSRKKNSKRFRPVKLRVNQTFSRNEDNFTSTSASGNECSDSSEDSVSMKDFYSHAYRKMKTRRTRRKNTHHVKLDLPQVRIGNFLGIGVYTSRYQDCLINYSTMYRMRDMFTN